MRKPLEAVDRSVAIDRGPQARARWVAPRWRTETHTWLIHKVEPASTWAQNVDIFKPWTLSVELVHLFEPLSSLAPWCLRPAVEERHESLLRQAVRD